MPSVLEIKVIPSRFPSMWSFIVFEFLGKWVSSRSSRDFCLISAKV